MVKNESNDTRTFRSDGPEIRLQISGIIHLTSQKAQNPYILGRRVTEQLARNFHSRRTVAAYAASYVADLRVATLENLQCHKARP